MEPRHVKLRGFSVLLLLVLTVNSCDISHRLGRIADALERAYPEAR